MPMTKSKSGQMKVYKTKAAAKKAAKKKGQKVVSLPTRAQRVAKAKKTSSKRRSRKA